MAFRILAPDVQDALHDALKAVLPAEVQLSRGYPAGGLKVKSVRIDVDYDAEIQRVISGGSQRDESGSVTVKVVRTLSTADPVAVRDGAGELAGYVEDVLTTDPTLGGVVEEAHIAASDGQEAIPDEHTRQYGLALRIDYTATATL